MPAIVNFITSELRYFLGLGPLFRAQLHHYCSKYPSGKIERKRIAIAREDY